MMDMIAEEGSRKVTTFPILEKHALRYAPFIR